VHSPSIKHWVPEILESKGEDISYFPYMDGTFVFKNAIVRFSEVIMEGLVANKLSPNDIDLFIPHQANLRISQFVQHKLKLSNDQIYNNIMAYGNTTAASIIIALTEAWEKGKVKDNDLIVLAAFGSGFTWGSVIIRW
jgi:3-oxoacyl-[acyl-carrier-protein] synthase-3